jgi:[protein-PII] uridylyltransferase
MTTAPSLTDGLRDFYTEESARIQREFTASGDGHTAVAKRTALVENVVLQLWKEFIAPEETELRNLALVALGGFGRGWLFPYSDIDLLFLYANHGTEEAFKSKIRRFSQELWDLRMKLSPATRMLAECDRFDPQNVEFTISLLDCRYLTGDRGLFDRLHDGLIPRMVMRESTTLVQRLAQVTRDRHGKYGGTIFHLEPNVKETPGGLRDYNVACWLSLISSMDKLRDWPDPGSLLPTSIRQRFDPALDFLMAVRCFLHFRHGRDDNILTWEAQDEAAARKIGTPKATGQDAAEWMRTYFVHARSIYRTSMRLLEDVPAARSSLYRQFQSWRSRLSNADFSVVDGRIFLQQPAALQDSDLLLRLFSFMAHHGLKLSRTTEHRVEQVLPTLAGNLPQGAELWRYLQSLLTEPSAADALREMHSLHVLTLLIPELKLVDSLVIRDYYHRFTVDEHSFLAIESLHRAHESPSEWDQRYGQILEELEQPELLYLTMLLHDVGKGTPGTDHVQSSLEIARGCLQRLDLNPQDRETVLFLIANHLEMSAAVRRDIFDPQNVRSFAERVGTPERLKMLCLLTYADIKAVNPEALTPWKAENVWQLYISASNYLTRSADQRLHIEAHADDTNLSRLQTLPPAVSKKVGDFLEGLPKRYLRVYSLEDVLHHAKMTERLADDPIQLDLKRGRHWFELTLVTNDRPFLFSNVTGTLAAWGMNIVKANAFSNQAGIVVDTFYFTDRFRTLELNLPEWERFKRSISDVLTGEADLERMLQNRMRAEERNGPAKVKVKTRIEFDDSCSSTSTLVQVIAQDRPGLLHRICSRFAYQKCNIEIALIDTEGQMAIDVFYLSSGGAQLAPEHQKRLQEALLEELLDD